MKATIAAGPLGALFLLEREFGRRRMVKGLYNWMKRAMCRAECDGDLSPHGLRGAAPPRLINAGKTAAQVCAVNGHQSLKEMER